MTAFLTGLGMIACLAFGVFVGYDLRRHDERERTKRQTTGVRFDVERWQSLRRYPGLTARGPEGLQ